MIRILERTVLDRFRSLVAGRLGLDLDDGKLDFVAGVLEHRLAQNGGITPDAYLDLLSGPRHLAELRALAGEITISETYFFRGPEHYRALEGCVLPDCMRARAGERRLRLLSAGCASGDEAYSLAILLRESFPVLNEWEVHIQGVDVNPLMVAQAVKGRYSAWALRATPPQIRDKYFRFGGQQYVLDPGIRNMVSFRERNLALENGCFPEEDPFDIVFCRNVLMYLVPGAAQQAIAGITRALAPDGYLFLGYAETLRGLSQSFQLRHTHDCFYYQRGDGEASPETRELSKAPAAPLAPGDTSWFEVVEKTGRSIDGLARALFHRDETPHAGAAQRAETPLELGLAFELLRQERFRDALELLDRLPPEPALDTDTQLLRAVLLAHCGDLDQAEKISRKLLGADDLNASAHYLMALCREHAGDASGAVEHDRAAIYLDQTFAMPHLHLGSLAKRAGDSMTARSELQRAATLLLREDAPRILLFGGGFGRDALVAFSRAQLRSLGERS